MVLPYKYIIPGEPSSFIKATTVKDRSFNPAKEFQLRCRIYLTQQQNDRPPFDGILALDIKFYFKNQIQDKTMKRFILRTPLITDLVRFYEEMGVGILWKDLRSILQVTASKHYDKDPRVEFNVIKMGTAK